MSNAPAAAVGGGFHVLAKPTGPLCNLHCRYCFYLEKTALYPNRQRWRMRADVLETFVRQYIHTQAGPEVHFAWQGGEPTLLGLSFFREVVALQRRHANGKTIANALQTNGTLLDDEWCEFLAAERFLVGISIDGPQALHDRYRLDKQQRPTFDAVMRGLECLKRHGVEFNTLTVVSRANSHRPREVYRFLKRSGSRFVQFIPLVEREAPARSKTPRLGFAEPVEDGRANGSNTLAECSVEPEQYGAFLCAVFDDWVRNDVGQTYVQLFDVALGNWLGLESSLCTFASRCGSAFALEHNGDVYSCDHYVYPRYRLGNLMSHDLVAIAGSDAQRRFASLKSDSLPWYCRQCRYRFACNGGCPKHRFATAPNGEVGLNYLCPAYKRFFGHVEPYMQTMARLINGGGEAAMIMDLVARRGSSRGRGPQSRNGLCRCGSGRKFKRCCGKERVPDQ